jgi:hypothetical protein
MPSLFRFAGIVNLNTIIMVLSALLTPTIGLIATYIAWQQHVTNRRQFRLALFEKRLTVFNVTVEFIAVILQKGNAKVEDTFTFQNKIREHEFLFGSEIAAYTDELRKNALKLWAMSEERAKNATSIRELLLWFNAEFPKATDKFKPYMNFTRA